MKRTLSVILLFCLLAASLSGCAGELLPLPSPPGSVETQTPEPIETPEPTPEPPAVPEELALGFILPASELTDEPLSYYFSPEEEFGCGFVYPSYCSLWVEKGAVRLDPGRFFARMFFSSVRKDAEGAPEELLDMLETGKWGTDPEAGTVGTGWPALRAAHLKYDTWRYWVAWETEERCCLLYGACFDHYGEEEILDAIFETIADSFRTSEELFSYAPERGELLRRSEGLSLYYDGTALMGGATASAALRLCVRNERAGSCELSVTALNADGREIPFDASCVVAAGEETTWDLSLPLAPEEGGVLCDELSLSVFARGDGAESLFELPVRIELSK